MQKYNLTIFTKYSLSIDIEADSREEAEEKLWDLYNDGIHDPVSDNYADVETNIEYEGYTSPKFEPAEEEKTDTQKFMEEHFKLIKIGF